MGYLWEELHELRNSDPLHAQRPFWKRPVSQMLFEPVRAGGMGLPAAGALLEAGVVRGGGRTLLRE